MKYSLTEEMVMRVFDKDEIPYRCARIEMWVEGDHYPREVGRIKVPEEIFSEVRDFIEELEC